jgi:hypothetical protein
MPDIFAIEFRYRQISNATGGVILLVTGKYGNQAVWFMHRKRLQENSLDYRKNGSIRPDAKCQRNDGHRGKAWGLSHHPESVVNVLPDIEHISSTIIINNRKK